MKKKMIIFCGSPRKKGTSYSFARTLKLLAEEKGWEAEIYFIIDILNQPESLSKLKTEISASEVLGLTCPLYVDTLPYPVIRFLEILKEDMEPELKGKRFFAVAQNGFPDNRLFKPLLESCRLFAGSAGMHYLGGLAYAGGVMINGMPLEDLGKRGQKIIEGFRKAMKDILQNQPISQEVQKTISNHFPPLVYGLICLILNRRARQTAKLNGVKDLRLKPY